MGVLGNRDFRRLWLADLASQFGSRIDVLAVPLLAVSTLGASVFEVSLLRTAETLPYLVLGLQVGAWCDRIRQRPLLIAADAGRAALIATVPVAALFGVLGLPQLLLVVLGVGILACSSTSRTRRTSPDWCRASSCRRRTRGSRPTCRWRRSRAPAWPG
ncbi:MFS transporter [Amycolatopsis sp. SID8362]|uniref:MFS transporter n=1 Tax=Amycolatopsis sp. SID8362 TaxID=2690346 RepID=UPI0021026884|nr:MFS transporter [Amycolatopsis sp. SID8362]